MAGTHASYQFTEVAEADLEKIFDHSALTWGPEKANSYLDGLESRAQILADNPDLGTSREELHSKILSFPYESHVLYYQKRRSGITIVRVLHQRMDPLKHL